MPCACRTPWAAAAWPRTSGRLGTPAGVISARGRGPHGRSARLSRLRAARLLPQDPTCADSVRLSLSGPGPRASLPGVRQGPRSTAGLGTEMGPQGGAGIRGPVHLCSRAQTTVLAMGYRARPEPRGRPGTRSSLIVTSYQCGSPSEPQSAPSTSRCWGPRTRTMATPRQAPLPSCGQRGRQAQGGRPTGRPRARTGALTPRLPGRLPGGIRAGEPAWASVGDPGTARERGPHGGGRGSVSWQGLNVQGPWGQGSPSSGHAVLSRGRGEAVEQQKGEGVTWPPATRHHAPKLRRQKQSPVRIPGRI